MVIRGGNEGGLDGIDVWGTNIWVHDVEVTNKDECVTVKVSISLSAKQKEIGRKLTSSRAQPAT